MKFHPYWELVLGSKIKVKVLRTLFRYTGKRFSVRELAQLSGIAHPPVLRSLADLEGMNLIRKEKHGTANVITLNRKSNLYPILSALFRWEKEAKEKLVQRLKVLLPPVKMAVLFGSVQTGREEIGSDIDLLLVTANKKKIEDQLSELRLRITEEFGNFLSPIVLTESQFKRAKRQPYALTLAKNYKVIIGADLIKTWWKR